MLVQREKFLWFFPRNDDGFEMWQIGFKKVNVESLNRPLWLILLLIFYFRSVYLSLLDCPFSLFDRSQRVFGTSAFSLFGFSLSFVYNCLFAYSQLNTWPSIFTFFPISLTPVDCPVGLFEPRPSTLTQNRPLWKTFQLQMVLSYFILFMLNFRP